MQLLLHTGMNTSMGYGKLNFEPNAIHLQWLYQIYLLRNCISQELHLQGGHLKCRWPFKKYSKVGVNPIVAIFIFFCPACSLIRLSCRRLTQSAINVNSKYGHQGPSSSRSAASFSPLFSLRFILFISLPECRLQHMVPRLRSLRNFCA